MQDPPNQMEPTLRYHNTSPDAETQDNLATALALAKGGLPVFPTNATKRPHVNNWGSTATTDPAQLRRWWRKWPGAMPAIPTGSRSGLAVLDLDLKNGKDGAAALRAMGLDPEELSPVSIATPSGGRHIYFRHADGLSSNTDQVAAGVDVRAEGGFVVAPGAVNGQGVYGRLSGPLKRILADLPDWPTALVPPPRGASKSTGEKSGLPFREIRDALMAVPNDGSNPEADSRDWWLKRLAALHHETDGGEDGLELAHAWSEQHPSYDPDKTDAAWRSFRRGDGATAATILADARAHGWRGETELARLDAAFDEMWTEAELDAQTQADIERLVGTPRRDKPRLTLLSPADCETLPARRYVIKGLLAEGDVATIVGAPGAGKSLLAPYLGYAVARGERAFGRRTRQGGVLYVAAEDPLGMRARVKALREELGEAPDFRLVEGVSDLLADKSADMKALKLLARDRRPSLIVIDTVALAFPGLEENDAKAMGRVVAVARALTRWGAAVVLIHHDTKDGANGLPRGHSILNGALDANLYLKRDDGIVSGRLTKNRNGSTDEKLAFTVATIPLGEDEDGDTITTAICREADNADLPEKEVKLSPSAKAALTVFFDVGDGAPVSEDDWREAAISGRKVSSAEDRDSRRRTFKRAVEELTRKNVLVFRDGQFAQGDSPEGWFNDDDA